MKILERTKSKITEGKKEENVHYLEITKLVIIYFKVVNNSYQQISRVLYTFVPNTLFGHLLDISPKKLILLKKFEVTKK